MYPLSEFLSNLSSSPLLATSFVLTLCVILVNGWTDAPNAIASCVATRCMTPKGAIALSSVFNFLGVTLMTAINSTVAQTVTKIVDFGNNTREATVAICAALFAIVLWAVIAWAFGIPTSESHALIAGLTGSAVALHKSLDAVNKSEWIKVIYGIIISVALGFALGFAVCKTVILIFKNKNRKKSQNLFKNAQIAAAAGMSFMHGAQDGQKFMGVILLCLYLNTKDSTVAKSFPNEIAIPLWLMLLCSLTMSIGTAIGGKRIIKSVGMNMVKLEKYQGFSADISAALSLLVCSLFSLPVSTTHAKTTAIMGVGVAKRASQVNFSVVKDMVLTWILTFPGCAAVGFAMTKIFLKIFN